MMQCHPHKESSFLSSLVAMGIGGASQNMGTSKGLTGPHWLPPLLPLAFEFSTKGKLKLKTDIPTAFLSPRTSPPFQLPQS